MPYDTEARSLITDLTKRVEALEKKDKPQPQSPRSFFVSVPPPELTTETDWKGIVEELLDISRTPGELEPDLILTLIKEHTYPKES